MNDLNSLMHASVDGARPDVDRLLAGAIRDGQRLQRRRRISYAGAGLAVAAIASVGAVAVGSHGGSTATEIAPASGGPADASSAAATPGAAALRAGQTFDLGHGITGTVVACKEGKPDEIGGNPACILPAQYAIQGSSTIPGTGTGFAVVLTGPAKAINDFWSNGFQSPELDGYQGLSWAVTADNPLIQPIYQGQNVTIHLAGWKQVGEVADDKQSLEGPGGAVADIVWRPASDYTEWTHGGMKSDHFDWISPVHDGVFVTIQPGQGTTGADIQALGDSLTWK